jgi:hypothetical protein
VDRLVSVSFHFSLLPIHPLKIRCFLYPQEQPVSTG